MFRSLVGHFFNTSNLTLDNFIFRLHYRVTVWLLVTCAVALLWKINYGNPINCQSADIEGLYLNDHCWYHGLYTNPETSASRVGIDTIAPGVDIQSRGSRKEFHNIHRWVIVGILVQAAFFFLPRILWKSLEGRLIERLLWNVDDRSCSDSDNSKPKRVELLAIYFRSGSFANFVYLTGYMFCEFINLLNVVVQLFLVSHILHLSTASTDMLTLSRSQRMDASALSTFPLITVCMMYKYGSSGVVQSYSARCVMSVNGVMETIFVCQWIWFVLLSVLSALVVLYRLTTVILPPFRVLKLQSKTKFNSHSTVQDVVRRIGVGEWFVLYMLSKNADPLYLRSILDSLSDASLRKEDSFSLLETKLTGE